MVVLFGCQSGIKRGSLFGCLVAVHPALIFQLDRVDPLTGDETRGGYVLKQPKKQKGDFEVGNIYYISSIP